MIAAASFTAVGVCPSCLSLIAIDAGKIVTHSMSRWAFRRCNGTDQYPKLSTQAAAPVCPERN